MKYKENILCIWDTSTNIKPRIILPPFLFYGQTLIFFIFAPSRIDICVHIEPNSYKMFIRRILVLRIMTITFWILECRVYFLYIFDCWIILLLDLTISHLTAYLNFWIFGFSCLSFLLRFHLFKLGCFFLLFFFKLLFTIPKYFNIFKTTWFCMFVFSKF